MCHYEDGRCQIPIKSFLLESCEKFPDCFEDSEDRSVGNQLVLRSASTYQVLVKTPS